MPKVGEKDYAYTKAGRAAAKSASKRTGKPITNKKKTTPKKRQAKSSTRY
jgi:hypothetical protein